MCWAWTSPRAEQLHLIFDIETTGLLRQGNKLHCIILRDAEGEQDPVVFDHRESQTNAMGMRRLAAAETVIGHNVIGFDIPFLQEIDPDWKPKGQVIDTLTLSRLYYANIKERDFERQPLGMPERLYGSHSLAAWGYRLKCHKGDYQGGWEKYNDEMREYAVQDTEVTLKLWQLLQRRINDFSA